jgi:hypothetical protein
MARKTGNQKLCGKRKCKSVFESLKAHLALGRYHPSADPVSDSKSPITTGTFSPLKADRPWRIVAGELTDEELRLATIGYKPERRRPGRSVPVNIVGGYRFPGARIQLAVIPLTDTGVSPGTPDAPPLQPELPDGDPLEVPSFLVRTD